MSQELPTETKLYKITPFIAKKKNIPIYFVGKVLKQTQKAAYIYGRGTTETKQKGICCACGRELKHPVSVLLGIGPICGGHWWDWDTVGGYNKDNLERLKGKLEEIQIDSWIPKSMIDDYDDTNEKVKIPENHDMLNGSNKKEQTPRRATLVKGKDSGRTYIKITFPFNYNDLDTIKSIPGRKFHKEQVPFWTAPLSIEAISILRVTDFEIDQSILDWEQSLTGNVEEIQNVDINLPDGLYDFQKKGVQFLHSKGGRGLIADEMGLGKTIQALGYLYANPDKRPAIVICPAAVKMNWVREAEKWIPGEEIWVPSGKKPFNPPKKISLFVINYDILPEWVDKLTAQKPVTVIADECHYFKNNKAKRTKAVKKLAKQVEHFIALSGTPIVNRPIEFYNAITAIEPGVFPSFWKYAEKYCDLKHNGFGWDFGGAKNTDELHDKLVNTIMLRRKKSDVLSELPAKQRAIVPMEITNYKEYQKVEKDFIGWVQETRGKEAAKKASNAEMLAQIEALKQAAIKGKMKASINWIKDFLEVDGKLVVFCTHRSTVDILMEEFGNIAVKVDGSTQDKQAAVDTFQDDDSIRLFVGNIKAAGTGITLTAASNVVFLELGWSPGDHDQAEDRIHRIGQEADAITAWYLLAQNTIEEEIAQMLDKKRKILDQVLDGKQPDQESLLTELIKKYQDRG